MALLWHLRILVFVRVCPSMGARLVGETNDSFCNCDTRRSGYYGRFLICFAVCSAALRQLAGRAFILALLTNDSKLTNMETNDCVLASSPNLLKTFRLHVAEERNSPAYRLT